MKFASRLQGVDESATFKYSNLAREKKVINFTIGRTNFSTPAAITEATKKALNEGRIHYTPTKGIPELRKAIAEKLRAENKIDNLSADNVLVSVGAKQIIYEAVMAIVEHGDVVAMSDPSWVSYESIVKLADGKVAWLPLTAENGFIPDEKYFSALENSKPKLILINSPNNPTGAVYPEKTIRKIVDIAERKDSIILSDEIYERIIYEGERFSAGSIYENTITVNGFSKEYSMTGWRLGYAASKNKELIDKMDLIQAQTVSCAVSFIQYGALGAYTDSVKKEVSAMIK
jgi:aspartate aminotransferase